MNTQQTGIDFGAVGWRLADVPITFGAKEGAAAYAKENKLGAVPAYVDSRPTIREVAKQLSEAENDACEVPQSSRHFGTVGPWDEYFHVQGEAGDRWPHDFRWIAVFVVVGGSEGMYLHVEAIDCEGTRRLLLLGKTCAGGRDAWAKCYESAGRISWLLNT